MGLCLGRPGSGWSIEDRREGPEMYPGLSDADCQVAVFHFRQLIDEGQRQQFVAGASPVSGVTRVVSRSVRRQVGAFLICVGQRLQGVQAATNESLIPRQAGEMGALA
jgi:hypothetical protein